MITKIFKDNIYIYIYVIYMLSLKFFVIAYIIFLRRHAVINFEIFIFPRNFEKFCSGEVFIKKHFSFFCFFLVVLCCFFFVFLKEFCASIMKLAIESYISSKTFLIVHFS